MTERVSDVAAVDLAPAVPSVFVGRRSAGSALNLLRKPFALLFNRGMLREEAAQEVGIVAGGVVDTAPLALAEPPPDLFRSF